MLLGGSKKKKKIGEVQVWDAGARGEGYGCRGCVEMG